ncbi:MAG: NfeD family protein [Candidatus Bipolaricaulota bacterium]
MRAFGLVLVVIAAAALGGSASEVWLLRIDGEIGRGTVSFIRTGLAEAEAAGAAAVVVEFATPGGYLDAAIACRDLILGAGIPTLAYVNREAYSAGALLALACERIYFAPGGVMGAATPVYFDAGGEMTTASEKTVSAVRALFRATAEERGRDPALAEAMVDPDVEAPGLVERGKLLTLTAHSAAEWGYSEGTVASLAALLAETDLAGTVVREHHLRWVDSAVATLTTPWLASLLIAIGVLGLLWEALTPGFGIAGGVGLAAFAVFFWAHNLAGLAGWESIVFLVAGIVAIVLEIFVFTATDFGLAGIAGLVLIGLGLYTSMIGPFTQPRQAGAALGAVSIALVVGLVLTVILLTRLPRSRLRLGGVILQTAITGRAGDRGQPVLTEWIGRSGVARTDLRPVGQAEFAGELVDVVAEEGFLPKGTEVEVVRDQGFRKVVRKRKEG